MVTSPGSTDGIGLNGANNPAFTILESGTTRGYSPAFATTAGSFSTDAAARDFIYRVEASTQRILFNMNGGTGGSTLALTGSRVGITKVNPTGAFHINTSEQIALQIDSATVNNILFVSRSGAVTVGLGAHPTFHNHKFMVFSGSISLRGPNDPNFSYRLNDTGSTNRNALFVSSSNYLSVGNIGYTGIELFHTSSFGNAYIPTGEYLVNSIYSNIEDNDVLGTPDKWLAVRVNNAVFAIPMYLP
jgi:hypothetical protein